MSASFEVGGSLWVSSGQFLLSASSFALADVHSNVKGTTNTFVVDGNTRAADGWQNNGSLTITGTLTMPEGKDIAGPGTATIASRATAPVTVPPPCDCSPEQRLDVQAIVESFRTRNDNEAMGIAADALVNLTQETTLDVPCGRLYLSAVTPNAKVTLKLAGRTAIFVGGHFSVESDFAIEAPPGSEVDLFVAGNVNAAGAFSIGSTTNPASARVYIGGGNVNLTQPNLFAGNLYAPQAELVLAQDTTIYGSVFAKRVAAQGALSIHFDESILTRPDTCEGTPEAGCGSCRDCGNQACIDGECSACTDSSQCCSPLVCRSGKCVPPASSSATHHPMVGFDAARRRERAPLSDVRDAQDARRLRDARARDARARAARPLARRGSSSPPDRTPARVSAPAWTISSIDTLASARAPVRLARTPGRSNTWKRR